MKFFHKYIVWFYVSLLVLGCVFYLLTSKYQNVALFYVTFILFVLGVLLLCYASWFKVVQIYKDYIYKTPQERFEIEERKATEIGFLQDYEASEKFKKRIYRKSLITNMCLGIVSLFVLIYLIVRLING